MFLFISYLHGQRFDLLFESKCNAAGLTCTQTLQETREIVFSFTFIMYINIYI
jgi:hypothetical protein